MAAHAFGEQLKRMKQAGRLAAGLAGMMLVTGAIAGDLNARIDQQNLGRVTGSVTFSEAQREESHLTTEISANSLHVEMGEEGAGNVDVEAFQLNIGNVEGEIDYGGATFSNTRALTRVTANSITVTR